MTQPTGAKDATLDLAIGRFIAACFWANVGMDALTRMPRSDVLAIGIGAGLTIEEFTAVMYALSAMIDRMHAGLAEESRSGGH